MEFREEYKKSVERLSPDREAMNRMKAAVMAKIAAGEGEPGIPGTAAKPLPLRRIAYIGGAAAACAVIAISAATILPNVSKADKMVSEAESSIADAGNMQSIADNAAADGAATPEFGYSVTVEQSDVAEDAAGDIDETLPTSETSTGSSTTAAGAVSDAAEDDDLAIDDCEDSPDDAQDISGDRPDTEVSEAVVADGADEPKLPGDNTNGDSGNGQDNGAAEEKDNDGVFEETDVVFPATGLTTEAGGITAEATAETEVAETLESWDFEGTAEAIEETVDVEESITEEEYVIPTIIFSGRGWITFGGIRYDPTEGGPVSGETWEAYDPVADIYYTVVRNGDEISVYDDGTFVGTYRKKA